MVNLQQYGFTNEQIHNTAHPEQNQGSLAARVLAVHKERYDLICVKGECHGRLKSSVYHHQGRQSFPTAGDFVLIDFNPAGDSLILETLPRKSLFSRRDPSFSYAVEQVVAANFDTVFLLQSLNHDYNPKRLERYLAMSWESGAPPVVVLTKADLVTPEQLLRQTSLAEETAANAPVLAISAQTGFGMELLDHYLLPGKTIVLLGSSGVGKSSLVNALTKCSVMEVRSIREDDSKGRHTTTHRQLITLPGGAMMIDTPGMRELGMWEAGTGLGTVFKDVQEYLGTCRFTDCTHVNEPGCAILAAIESGELPAARWENYKKMQRESLFAENRGKALKNKQTRNKSIAKWNRQRQKSEEKWN